MEKKLFGVVFVVLVLCFVGNTIGTTIYWNHAGADNLWTTPENWVEYTGVPMAPGLNDFVSVHAGAGAPPFVPEFKAGMTESISTLRLSCGHIAGPTDVLDMSGGSLSVVNTGMTGNSGDVLIGHAGNSASILMSGGTLAFDKSMIVGLTGYGNIDMTNGLIDGTTETTTQIQVNFGHIDLHGGDIVTSYITMSALNGGTMDFEAGVLTVTGPSAEWCVYTHLQGFVDSGDITAYGGASGSGSGIIMKSWNETTGEAKMWAVPEPATMILLGLGGLLSLRRRRSLTL